MAGYFISPSNFTKLIEQLIHEFKVYGAVEDFDKLHFERISLNNLPKLVVNKYRPADSPKQFVFNFQEVVSKYFSKEHNPHVSREKTILLGVKACDLSALEVQDKVYLEGDYRDPFYAARRENLIIISSDCSDCLPVCFCTLVGGKPYPRSGYDINISILGDGYLIDVGTKKGQHIIDNYANLFADASRQARDEQEKSRQLIEKKVNQVNDKYKFKASLSEIHASSIESPAWREIAKNCVECSCCNRVCPSCTCFLLVDYDDDKHAKRVKFWDNCLMSGYAKVAGGANSRPLLRSRLENRYECKFNYSFKRLGRYTCVGCGRCIEGCMGRIDMREAFKTMEKQIVLSAEMV